MLFYAGEVVAEKTASQIFREASPSVVLVQIFNDSRAVVSSGIRIINAREATFHERKHYES